MCAAMSQPDPIAAPVAEIERRLHWRVLSVGAFLALMVTLAVTAAVSVLVSITMFQTVSGVGINSAILAITFLLSGIIIPLPLFP
jgi:ABC-type uncharacterized transport system permease subunit